MYVCTKNEVGALDRRWSKSVMSTSRKVVSAGFADLEMPHFLSRGQLNHAKPI